MLPQQKLWFLNSFQYTWFTIAPEHAIISSDPDDATHFANVVHIACVIRSGKPWCVAVPFLAEQHGCLSAIPKH